MTIIETVLVFGGIPLLVFLLLAAAVFGRSAVHQPNRYRPGRPWQFGPVWYVPHPDAVAASSSVRAAIEGSASPVTAIGGASGEW